MVQTANIDFRLYRNEIEYSGFQLIIKIAWLGKFFVI